MEWCSSLGMCLQESGEEYNFCDGTLSPDKDLFVYCSRCLSTQNLPRFFHDGGVAAIAGSTGLAQEHVEIVTLVIPLLEAFRAQRHAR